MKFGIDILEYYLLKDRTEERNIIYATNDC